MANGGRATNKCNHNCKYKKTETETTKFYGDNKVAYEVIEDIYICEKCLSVKKRRKVSQSNGGGNVEKAIELINERIKNGIEYRKELAEQIIELEKRKDELNKRVDRIEKEEDELLLAIEKLKG